MPRSEPIKPLSEAEYAAYIRKIIPKKTTIYVVIYWHADDDPIDGYRPGGKREIKLRRSDIIRVATNYYEEWGLTLHSSESDDPVLPSTIGHVYNDVAMSYGSDDGGVRVYTAKDMAKQREEELRQKGERTAAMICSRYGVKSGTLKFIHAVYRHYNGIMRRERHFRDDGESRAERYATCVMGGAGRDAFYEDNDYASSLINNASDELGTVLQYLNRYCPLLMARYRERRAQKRKGQS